MEWIIHHDLQIRIILPFISSIIWLVFFLEAMPWKNMNELKEKKMLKILIIVYLLQCLVLWGYGFAMVYSWFKHKYLFTPYGIVFTNWFVWLVNTAASREAIPRGYKKLGKAGLIACFLQLLVYLKVFIPLNIG